MRVEPATVLGLPIDTSSCNSRPLREDKARITSGVRQGWEFRLDILESGGEGYQTLV